jgi:predicted ATPase/DNA-binding SARP family transcriptional activator
MEIHVLGPLELVGDNGPLPLAAMPRRLLAALVVRAGETCSTDLLIEALWAEAPPTSAAKLLQVYVSQLRKALPRPASIRTQGSGYALEIEHDDSLDARRFERLLEEGREAMRAGNPALAASLLRRALSLWRGGAYGDLAYEEFARTEADRLEELRLVCTEERLEAGLALGRHAELVPELQSLAAAHPLRERLQAQTMLGLYRCGRQSAALELYTAFRMHLRNELGLEPGPELRELQRRILQQDSSLAVAPVEEAAAIPLPAPPNALLGRQRELDELRDRLLRDDVRLLVLTGAGGSGKTRLALEAARQNAACFANGATFVELAPLDDPALVPAAVARALAVREMPGEDTLETLATALRPRELLLVLDNAEHLRAGAATFNELLGRAPRLTLLVTSRVVLHVSGEHVYPVEPLAEEAAVALFHQRAREADARFRPDPADEQAIRRICARLDGLPLAIELAAARTRMLTPQDLLDRLDARLPLLTGGHRDAPARQQTLRATLQWSFNLLATEEQQLFARLAVFVGSFDLDGAAMVCSADLDGLTSLVEHSLLERDAEGRFFYLETIRELARERLEGIGEAAEIRLRHAEHFVSLAEQVDAELRGYGAEWGNPQLEREADNVRAALSWLAGAGYHELELRLVGALDWFWCTSHPEEGRNALSAVLARSGEQPDRPRARALLAGGSVAWLLGDLDQAERFLNEALLLYRNLSEPSWEGQCLHQLGAVAHLRQDLDRAAALLDESARCFRAMGDDAGLAAVAHDRGLLAYDQGDFDKAETLFDEATRLEHELGLDGALANSLCDLGWVALRQGRLEHAGGRFRQSLELAREVGWRVLVYGCLSGLAAVAVRDGEALRATKLAAAALALRDDTGVRLPEYVRLHEETVERIRDSLDAEAFEVAWGEGQRMSLDDAISFGLTEAGRSRRRRSQPDAAIDRVQADRLAATVLRCEVVDDADAADEEERLADARQQSEPDDGSDVLRSD